MPIPARLLPAVRLLGAKFPKGQKPYAKSLLRRTLCVASLPAAVRKPTVTRRHSSDPHPTLGRDTVPQASRLRRSCTRMRERNLLAPTGQSVDLRTLFCRMSPCERCCFASSDRSITPPICEFIGPCHNASRAIASFFEQLMMLSETRLPASRTARGFDPRTTGVCRSPCGGL